MNSNLDNHPPGRIRLPAGFSASTVAAWLEELPLANIDYSGDAVLALLRALNGAEGLRCGERFGVVEQLRSVAFMLAQQGVEVHLRDAAFPLTPAVKRYAKRGIGLSLELGKAYGRVVASGDFFSDGAMVEELRVRAIDRALEAYGVALLRAMENYVAPPEGFWRDVYGLYRLAEDRHLHVYPLPDPEADGRNGAMILDRVKHIALFALANSHRHRPGEIRQIYAVLGACARNAEIHAAPLFEGRDAVFYFDLGADARPRQIKSVKGESRGRRFLFTHALVPAALEHFADPAKRRMGGGTLGRSVLTHLLKSLTGSDRRKSPRLPGNGELRLIVGLRRLIGELSGAGDPGGDSGGSTVQYKGISWLNVPDFSLEEREGDAAMGHMADARMRRSAIGIDKLLRERGRLVARDEIWADRVIGVAAPKSDMGSLSGGLLNSSARGYCLLWTTKNVAGARVGELVGLPDDDGGALHIGVIRWLNHDANADLMFGVELLAPAAEMVEIDSAGERDSGRQALLLPANARLQQAASLLVQPACYEEGQVIVVETARGSHIYRLGKLQESTPSFQHFKLSEAQKPPVLIA